MIQPPTTKSTRRIPTWLKSTRYFSVLGGASLIIGLGLAPEASLSGFFGLAALLLFGVAAAAGWMQLGMQRKLPLPVIGAGPRWSPRLWQAVLLVVTVTLVVAAQSWFRGTSVIAAGDETLPNGTAWTKHVFDPWVWSGSNLGGPGALQMQLPWALLLQVVTSLRGSEGLAQRIWLTLLFAGVGLTGAIVIRSMGLHPIGGLVGGLMYALNPFTLSSGGGNVVPVFLATQIGIGVLVSIIFGAARGRISTITAALLLGWLSPLFGFIFQTPPQLGITILSAPLALGLTWWLWGRSAAVRGLRALAIGALLLAALSAYWAIPAAIQARTAATDLLTGIATWHFTEARATLTNAFWLNTHWTWSFPQYVPYASNYAHLPLKLVVYLLPAVLMTALLLGRASVGADTRHRAEGLAIAVPLVNIALLIAFMSTGTGFPAGPIFTRLYSLPYGWLLREPGRFLVINALIYAVLAGLLVSTLVWERTTNEAHSLALGRAKSLLINLVGASERQIGLSGALIALAVLSSYPLVTGEVIPDKRGPSLPPAHVNYPSYWSETASYLNAPERNDGAVLVLPLDDFYQMPYQFGFYGSDSFVTNLIDRHVLLPVPQGYFTGTPGLASTVALGASYLQNRDWARGARLLSILGVSYVLLRGDIVSFPGRGVDLPSNYATLFSDPLLRLDHAFGPLSLFATTVQAETGTRTTDAYWTTDLPNIDPHMLADLPLGVHLVAHKPIPGVPTLSTGGGQALSINDFESVRATSLIVQTSGNAAQPGLASKPPSLTISEEGYSDGWSGPGGGERVAVDGLFNGWIARSTTSGQIAVVYGPARFVTAGAVVTMVGVVLSILYLLASWPYRRFRLQRFAILEKVRRATANRIDNR